MKSELVKQAVRDGRNVIEYQTRSGEMMDGLVLKKCKEGQVPNVLKLGAVYENQHNYMYAYTDHMDTLNCLVSDVVSDKIILTAFESIVSTLVYLQDEEINLAYVILDADYIFIDETTGRAKLICMPAKQAADIDDELEDFFRNILSHAIYLNSEDGDYVAKLLSALNKDFDLKSFLRTIHSLMRDANIDIVEEPEPEAEPVAPSPEPEAEPAAPSPEPEAEPATPSPEPEPEAAEVPSPSPIEATSGVTMGIVPEDDIEFEPIPEELNAKIERMNNQSAAQPQSAPQPQQVVQPAPQPVVQSVAQPQQVVQPVPQPAVQSVAQPQQVVQPVPQPAVQPVPQPTVQSVAQPQQVVQPVPGPRPMYMPSDVGIQVPPQQKQPSPHLIRVKTGEYIMLPEGQFVIGKSANGVNYTITDNSAVSRVHCTIYKKQGVYYVRDEKSTNSTYINGEQLLPGGEHLLTNNCKLCLGDEEFTFQLW